LSKCLTFKIFFCQLLFTKFYENYDNIKIYNLKCLQLRDENVLHQWRIYKLVLGGEGVIIVK